MQDIRKIVKEIILKALLCESNLMTLSKNIRKLNNIYIYIYKEKIYKFIIFKIFLLKVRFISYIDLTNVFSILKIKLEIVFIILRDCKKFEQMLKYKLFLVQLVRNSH